MVSAKRAEEHIVEGLSSGSNDYIVKPFGRKEILARVAAHLEFRDSVYKAGEEAGEVDCGGGGWGVRWFLWMMQVRRVVVVWLVRRQVRHAAMLVSVDEADEAGRDGGGW